MWKFLHKLKLNMFCICCRLVYLLWVVVDLLYNIWPSLEYVARFYNCHLRNVSPMKLAVVSTFVETVVSRVCSSVYFFAL